MAAGGDDKLSLGSCRRLGIVGVSADIARGNALFNSRDIGFECPDSDGEGEHDGTIRNRRIFEGNA
jgi:hypothetical protein